MAAARAEVDAACRELLSPSPSGLDRSAARLEAATGRLNAARGVVDGGANVMDVRGMQDSLRHARLLLDGAARFHQGWLARLGALSSGYTRGGIPAPVDRSGRVLVHG